MKNMRIHFIVALTLGMMASVSNRIIAQEDADETNVDISLNAVSAVDAELTTTAAATATEVNTTAPQDQEPVDWSRDTQKRAVTIWISFLTAAVMSLICFAFIDPLVLVDAVNLDGVDSRELGYTIGFFFFWLGTATSSALCLRLARRKRQQPRPIGAQTTE